MIARGRVFRRQVRGDPQVPATIGRVGEDRGYPGPKNDVFTAEEGDAWISPAVHGPIDRT